MKLRILLVPTGPVPVESRFGNQTMPLPERAPSGLAARPPPEAAVGRRGRKGRVFVRFHVVLKPGFHRHGAGGAADVTKMRNFKDLSRTQVTDAGLQHLERFTELQHLDLSDTQVTDTGLEHLTQLKRLRTLDLHDTKVTDAGLRHLNCLRELGELWLEGTQVTDPGVAELRKTLPRALIHR